VVAGVACTSLRSTAFLRIWKICFDEVVKLSGLPGGENVTFTVTYRKGDQHKPEGSLVEGECVEVKDGMVVNVTRTNKS
jgi:hypothetical protein